MPKPIRTWLSRIFVVATFASGLGVATCGDVTVIGTTGDPSSCTPTCK